MILQKRQSGFKLELILFKARRVAENVLGELDKDESGEREGKVADSGVYQSSLSIPDCDRLNFSLSHLELRASSNLIQPLSIFRTSLPSLALSLLWETFRLFPVLEITSTSIADVTLVTQKHSFRNNSITRLQ